MSTGTVIGLGVVGGYGRETGFAARILRLKETLGENSAVEMTIGE